MRKKNWLANTISIKVRYPDFKTITRDRTLKDAVDDLGLVYTVAKQLLPENEVKIKGVRLIGVRVANLTHPTQVIQPDLFIEPDEIKKKDLDCSVDTLRQRFGERIITRAGTMLFG